ncbi:hypothetical protein BUH_1947 [Burkholderia pseudomallei Pakistan 9]|nr:hypothetical protein BUH_1947 [Burkholderia pseudomallei Pakistan 9]
MKTDENAYGCCATPEQIGDAYCELPSHALSRVIDQMPTKP